MEFRKSSANVAKQDEAYVNSKNCSTLYVLFS